VADSVHVELRIGGRVVPLVAHCERVARATGAHSQEADRAPKVSYRPTFASMRAGAAWPSKCRHIFCFARSASTSRLGNLDLPQPLQMIVS
jgi:hypothetical protein